MPQREDLRHLGALTPSSSLSLPVPDAAYQLRPPGHGLACMSEVQFVRTQNTTPPFHLLILDPDCDTALRHSNRGTV
jgi:hypothetical protein